jgi:hypothetical protein
MFQDILRGIAGIEVFPILSLVLFVALFAIAVIAAVRMDPRRIARLAGLPLEGADEDPDERSGSDPRG